MSVFESLTPTERARQLSNPEGAVGIAVAEWLYENNRQANAEFVASLDVVSGCDVLEIGFGNGRTAPDVIAQAADVRYAGLDISPTMVEEARRFNATLVAAGRASFHLGNAERMPFPDSSFDRVFSVGVAHFWADPVAPLAEVRRVLRPGGRSFVGCLHPQTAPNFAQPEFGFYLRDAATWETVHRAAGFGDVKVEAIEFEQIAPDGTSTKRYVFHLMACA